jgi:crotonobetainyl-CoA:carnitine CoA-transferase CaiB-like acyl-CoA transferase
MANTYRTADDRWVALCMIEGDKYWPGLCHALGRDDLVDDARFATDADRSANIEACIAELDAVFAGRTLAAWREAMAQQPGQWDVVKQSRELVDDPQAVTNGFVQRVVYADGGELPMVSAPVQFDRTPPALSPAPALGADTEAVLREAGLDDDEIDEARASGLIG